MELVCSVFDTFGSSYHDYSKRRSVTHVVLLRLRTQINELFNQSVGAAGIMPIVAMMQERGYHIGRFAVRGLMRGFGLMCKQHGPHKYRDATVERIDIPNILELEFDVPRSNPVWCGYIVYIRGLGRWHYLAVILGLHCRRMVGWAMSRSSDASLAVAALEMACVLHDRSDGIMIHSDQRCQYSSCVFLLRLWCYPIK